MSRTTRVNVTFQINLKYPDRATFVERFSQNISRTGLFVRAQDPLPVGSRVNFDYRLADGLQVLRGSGIVRWIRTPAQAKEPAQPPGMGVEFIDLDPSSETLVGQIVNRYGEGARAPRRARQNPRLAPSGLPPPSQTLPDLGPEESQLLDVLGEDAGLGAGPVLNAEALARMVAQEGFEDDPLELEVEGLGQDDRPNPGWFVVDLAGTDVAAALDEGRTLVVPRLRVDAGRLRINGQGTYVPTLISCLSQPWPSPHPAALGRRLGVAFYADPQHGEVTLRLGTVAVPIAQALRAFVQAALQKLAPHSEPLAAVAVVPTTLPGAATQMVEWLLRDLGFKTVRIVSNALALLKATPVAPDPTDVTLTVTVGALAAEIALLEGYTALHPTLSMFDLGFGHADAEVHNRLAVQLLKEGVDVDDDSSLADDLMQQVTRHRRAAAPHWPISLAGADLQIEVTKVARWLVPASERLMLMCDAMMRNHVPAGRHVKNLVLAGDEPLWPGVREVLQQELGLTPIVLANGSWSRLDGARRHVDPQLAHGAQETCQ